MTYDVKFSYFFIFVNHIILSILTLWTLFAKTTKRFQTLGRLHDLDRPNKDLSLV